MTTWSQVENKRHFGKNAVQKQRTNVLVETGLKGANHGIDRYPMDVGQDGMSPHVIRLNAPIGMTT